MNGINWTALISGLVTLGSTLSIATGHPVLGAAISNPTTAQALTAVIAGLSGIYSTFAPALMHSTTTAAAAQIAAAKQGAARG